MFTLIMSIQGTAPVPKPPPIYAPNPVQADPNLVIDYGSVIGAKRYRYLTAALSLNKFNHTTGKVLNITTSITERSYKCGWGSGTG